MNFQEFKKSAQEPLPIYVLHTEQDYLKDKVRRFCEGQVDESVRAFDWVLVNLARDRTTDSEQKLLQLINAARTLPWMSQYRWVYVKNAHEAAAQLKDYVQDPAPQTVMILETGRKVRAWAKLPTIEISGSVDYVGWVREKARREGYAIEPGAAERLVSLVGDELSRLESELEKQFLWCHDSKQISVDSVLDMSVEARERDVFELISAMAGRKADDALRILNRLFVAGTSHHQVLGMLYWNFSRLLVAKEMMEQRRRYQDILGELKIWSYRGREREVRRYTIQFLSRTLLRLRETDRLSKTSNADPRLHLERLIIDTCGKASV